MTKRLSFIRIAASFGVSAAMISPEVRSRPARVSRSHSLFITVRSFR
jgi:hypothetical protein